MRIYEKRICFFFLIILAICIIYRIIIGNTHTTVVEPFWNHKTLEELKDISDIEITPVGEDNLEFYGAEFKNDYLKINIRPVYRGDSEYIFSIKGDKSGRVTHVKFQTDYFMTVYNETEGDFTGDYMFLIMLAVFFGGICLYAFKDFYELKENGLYSYSAIYLPGLSLYTGILALFVTLMSVLHFINPHTYSMKTIYRFIANSGESFVRITFPFVFVFSIMLIVSNINLLRHEHVRALNLLGIFAPCVLMCGMIIYAILASNISDGTTRLSVILDVVENIYSFGFAYFECMFAGAVMCGLRTALHEPSMDKDYIIILGCRFRKDGTLTPLLKSRCDKGIEFWKNQIVESGKKAVIIVSGGQGDDEIMSEAEAMHKYLLSRKIPRENIRKEDRSKNTFENMRYSKKIIFEENKNAKVAFATTNYHVFRSGMLAGKVGMNVEGVGSDTKWWFWPNAFMRECLGLFANRWRYELLNMIVIATNIVALTLVGHI